MLRFTNNDDFIEIDLANRETDEVPSKGDALLTLRISSSGFSGHNDLWVLGPELQSFCRALVAPEHQRTGQAVLDSISPDELHLAVRSVNSRGHMMVQGSTGYYVQGENPRPWHAVHFGFEFDPSQLAQAIKVNWVQQYDKVTHQ